MTLIVLFILSSVVVVEIRRRELERFLRRAVVHPELQDCASLDVFLRADDMTFQAAKNSKGDSVVTMQQSGIMGMANSMMGTPHTRTSNSMMMPSSSQSSPNKKDGFKRWFAETKTSISGDLVSKVNSKVWQLSHAHCIFILTIATFTLKT